MFTCQNTSLENEFLIRRFWNFPIRIWNLQKNGLIVITPDFDNFTTKLIAADEYSKYMTETPILEGVANREYYGRSATSIENKSTIEYGTEQGLAALIYGEQGVSSLPIQDIRGEYIDTDNEYMYYYSVEFIK